MKEVCLVHIYHIRRHSKETIWFQKTLLYQILLFWTLLKTNVKMWNFLLWLSKSVIVHLSHFIKFEISAQLSYTCDNTRELLEDPIMQHLWTEFHLFYEKVWNHNALILDKRPTSPEPTPSDKMGEPSSELASKLNHMWE